MAGRRCPQACVSLKIARRCNLDCTLCYLSESAEAVRDSPQAAQTAWSRVLSGFVNAAGEVDFEALARDRADLDQYVRHVADTPLASLPVGPMRLAHIINAYNALSMFNVLRSGIPETHAGWRMFRFFVLRKLDIGGQALSLYSF